MSVIKTPFNFKKTFSISNDCDLEEIDNYKKLNEIYLKNGLHISSSFWIGNINSSNGIRKILFNKNKKHSIFNTLINDYHDGFLDHFHNYNEDNVNIIEYLNKGIDVSLNNNKISIINGNNIDNIKINNKIYISKIKENISYYDLENLTIIFFSKEKISNLDIILAKSNENICINVECFYIDTVNEVLDFINNNLYHFNEIKNNYNYYYRIKYFNVDIKLSNLQYIELLSNDILIEKIIISDFSYKIIENQLNFLRDYNTISNFIPKHGGNFEYYLKKRGLLKKNLFFKDIGELIKDKLVVKCCWSDDIPSFPFLNKSGLEYFKNNNDSCYLELNNINIRETTQGYYISRNSFYPLCSDKDFETIYYNFKKGNLSNNNYDKGLEYLSNKFKINFNYLKSIIPYNLDKMSFSQGNMMPFYLEYTFITKNIEYFWYTHFGTYNFENIDLLEKQLKKLSKKYYSDNEIMVMSSSCFVNYKIMMYNLDKLLNNKSSKWIDIKTDSICYKNNSWNINIKYLKKYNYSSLLNYLTLTCDSTWSVRLFINGIQYYNFYRDHKNKTLTIIDNTKGVSLLGNIKEKDILIIKDCIITNRYRSTIIKSINNNLSFVKLKVNNIKIYNVSCIRLKMKKTKTTIKNISIKIHSTNGVLEILNNISENPFNPSENNYIFFEFYQFGINDIYLPIHNIIFKENPSFLYGEIISIEIKIETYDENEKIEINNLELFSNAGNINDDDNSLIFKGKITNITNIQYNILIKNNTTDKLIKINDESFFLKMKYGDDISILSSIYNNNVEIDKFIIMKNTLDYEIVIDENIFNNNFLNECNFILVNNDISKYLNIDEALDIALDINYPCGNNINSFYRELIEINSVPVEKYIFSHVDFLNKLFLELTKNINDDVSKIKKICNYLCKRVYHNFSGNTIVYNNCKNKLYDCPVWIILHRLGKCGQVNRTLYDILEIQGYDVRVVQLVGHVACEVYINDKWWLLDVNLLKENEFYYDNDDLISAKQIYQNSVKYIKLFSQKFETSMDILYKYIKNQSTSDINYNNAFRLTNINNNNDSQIINLNLIYFLKKKIFTIEKLNYYLRKHNTNDIYIVSNFILNDNIYENIKYLDMSHYTIVNEKIVCINIYWWMTVYGRDLNRLSDIFSDKPYYYVKVNKYTQWDSYKTLYE